MATEIHLIAILELRIGGEHAGIGTLCADDPCSGTGACCTVAGCVGPISQTICEQTPGNVFAGDGTDCSDVPDPCGSGACCTDTDCADGVLRTEGYPGASGVITLLPDGNARKRPFLLGVRGQRLIPLD